MQITCSLLDMYPSSKEHCLTEKASFVMCALVNTHTWINGYIWGNGTFKSMLFVNKCTSFRI